MNIRFAKTVTVLAAAAGATVSAQITPLEQDRFTGTLVNASQCAAGFGGDMEEAAGFEAFDSILQSEQGCDSGTAIAYADQHSEIGGSIIVGTGATSSQAWGPATGVIHAIANTHLEVTFDVTAPSMFTAQGLLGASGTFPVFAHSSLTLLDADLQARLSIFVVPGPNGEPANETFNESGPLEPGGYTLRVDTATIIDAKVPPGGAGTAMFELSFGVDGVCAADVDSSGAVAVQDLVAVILAWGPCLPGPCAADVTQDGAVDVSDLVAVILAWGDCP